ncbi:hypothetical protein LZ31DRAFT_554693 [Colletotrichum somersetense]|nr:hypothetical protein LZ31DRAFT_554693 [Colletotrichum somersetense]
MTLAAAAQPRSMLSQSSSIELSITPDNMPTTCQTPCITFHVRLDLPPPPTHIPRSVLNRPATASPAPPLLMRVQKKTETRPPGPIDNFPPETREERTRKNRADRTSSRTHLDEKVQ